MLELIENDRQNGIELKVTIKNDINVYNVIDGFVKFCESTGKWSKETIAEAMFSIADSNLTSDLRDTLSMVLADRFAKSFDSQNSSEVM